MSPHFTRAPLLFFVCLLRNLILLVAILPTVMESQKKTESAEILKGSVNTKLSALKINYVNIIIKRRQSYYAVVIRIREDFTRDELRVD